ncbi:peptide deformylase [Candidatus Uhrbacteria bacterium]|nr:peptide deformylase [Candidatus Uhrbacteria bacterium]
MFDGLPVRLSLKGLPAIIFQHEIDHLDGVLFIDKVVGETRASGTAI